jgi:hypothetical protein
LAAGKQGAEDDEHHIRHDESSFARAHRKSTIPMDYEVSAHRGGEACEAHKRELARLRELEQKVEQKIEPNQIQPPVQKSSRAASACDPSLTAALAPWDSHLCGALVSCIGESESIQIVKS